MTLRERVAREVAGDKLTWNKASPAARRLMRRQADNIIALVEADAESAQQSCAYALDRYGQHECSCPLAKWEGNYGFKTKYDGKWYRWGEEPACTCGFSAALSDARRGKP